MKKGSKILVGTAVMAVSAFIGWKVWKNYKDELGTGEVISVEDIKRLKEAAGVSSVKEPIQSHEDVMEDEDDEDVMEDEDDEDVMEDEDDEDVMEEGGDIMRKGTNPNSLQALEQYINMLTADFEKNSKNENVIRLLFDIPFNPETAGDKVLLESLQNKRFDFFGPMSTWGRKVSWGDVFIHFAESIDYEIGGGVYNWVNYLIRHTQLDPRMSTAEIKFELTQIAKHNFINHSTGMFGLFGLDDSGCEDLNNQLAYAIEKRHTFQMEFNAFIEMKLSEEEETADFDEDDI